MLNVYYAMIVVLVELAALGLSGLGWLAFRRGGFQRRHAKMGEQEVKLLACQLVQTHEALMKQLQAWSASGKPSPAEADLIEAASQLRAVAARLASGQASPLQLSQSLLVSQEAILGALAAVVREGTPYPAENYRSGDLELPAPSSSSDLSAASLATTTERVESGPLTKSEDELQAEINALLEADESAQETNTSPAETSPMKVEISSSSLHEADPPSAPLLPGKQIRGLSDDEFQEELDALLNPGKTEAERRKTELEAEAAPKPAKKTEAEIEAEMQADLDLMMSSMGGGMLPSASAVPAPGLEPASEAAPEAEPKLTEAEIEAMMQADLEAMLSASVPDESPRDPGEAALQNEIDALLRGGVAEAQSELVAKAAPSSPEPAADLQAEIDALLGGFSQPASAPAAPPPSAPPPPAADLQAEIDALLSGTPVESKPSSFKPATQDLQAEIDALLSAAAAEPISEFHRHLESEIEERLAAREQNGAPAHEKLSNTDLQAEIDALLKNAESDPPSSVENPPLADMQAEIDALLRGGVAEAQSEPVAKAAPSSPEPAADLQAEIDALLGGFSQPVPAPATPPPSAPPPPATADLQAEIDALLGNFSQSTPAVPTPAASAPTPAAMDLQAEIDALLLSAAADPARS